MKDPALIHVRLLEASDDRGGFCSGDPDLDRFFARFAGQNQFKHHIGTTYVAVNDGVLCGFATISAAHLEIAALPQKARRRLPNYPLPVLRLARLAVDRAAQGRGVGKILLKAVFQIAQHMAETVGCVGIVVDAKASAVAFYEQYGFEPLEAILGTSEDRPVPLPMFLPLAEIPATV